MSRILELQSLPLDQRRVLLRVDFNVPLQGGEITDDLRIRSALPTIRHLQERGCKLILCSHLGRPKGQVTPIFSLEPAAARLAELLEDELFFADDCVGQGPRKLAQELREGQILVLENLRFHPGEESNDPIFGQQLAELAEVYVSDAFGSLHRAHASVTGVPTSFPDRCAGFLVHQELQAFAKLVEAPEAPYTAIIGGAKISDKLPLLKAFLKRIHTLCIGGAMAYTFLTARDQCVGTSRVEKDRIWAARELLDLAKRRGVRVLLPEDHVVSESPENHGGATVVDSIPEDSMGLDIGPRTRARFAEAIEEARTVFWNGPMGLFEVETFAAGTRSVARAIHDSSAFSVIGGGDSAAAVRSMGLEGGMSHISTGGGAALTWLGGKTLPGLRALEIEE